MAPMTRSPPMARSTRSSAFPNELSNSQAVVPNNNREESWQFEGDDQSVSENPSGSFQDYDGEFEYDSIKYQPTREEVAENHEDILHPLREAANRVGREVERFAEVLDGYNPLKAIDDADKKDMTFDLIDSYHDIALETVKRLRAAHFRRKDGGAGRKKIHGFAIARDPDAMDEDESDDQEPLDLNSKTTLQDLERWEQEARTWDLLRRMTTLQYDPPKVEDAPQIHRYSPERQIWNSFLQNDTLGLERNTVLDWLKITADESGEDIDVLVQELQQNAERGDITAHGWLHTKSAIKSQKRLHAWPYVLDHTSPDVQLIHLNASKTEALVTELDPDAPVRQGRKLEAPDEYFERAIWHGCYELLRRGKSGEEIREWCRDRQEIWRAVSMSGLPDENLDSDEAASDSNSKALWRRMCYALSKRGGTDKYENAVYGILAGDFWSVAPVCRTWDDHLFVHYNALVRSQYEVYVQKHFPSRAPQDAVQSIDAFDAISFHGVPETVGPRTVALLNNKSELQTETRQPMKMLQGVLIAKEFHSYVYEQGVAISKAANVPGGSTSVLIANLNVDPKDAHKIHYIKTEDFDSLRVLTHMLLAFKSLGMSFGDKMQTYAIENVIVAYISFLRLAGKEELIPLYAAQLSDERAYATLGRELLDVTDPEQRVTQIKLMKELGLDVQRFVRLQMKFLMDDYPDTEKGYPATGKFSVLLEARPMNEGVPLVRRIRPDFMGDTVDRPEMLMIRAFEWYQYVEGMWSETFRTGTMLYKRFFKHMKLAAARQLKNSTPARDIAANKTPVILGEAYELSDLTAEVEEDEDVPEELDDKAAEITRLLKRHMAEEARTFQDLEKLVHALDFIEGVAGIIDALEISQVKEDEILSKQMRTQFHNNFFGIRQSVTALLKDWLVKGQDEDPDCIALRAAYLPEVILAYDSILSAAGLYITRDNFLESMELATLVAAEGSDLAELFVRTRRMADLAGAFAGDALALLYSTAPGKSRAKPGRRARERGWRREVWEIGGEGAKR